MHRILLPCAVTTVALLVTTSEPARAQNASRGSDVARSRAAAERTLDRGSRLRLIGGVGAGMALAANFMSAEQKASGAGTALVVGGVTALGLGLIGDFARYRGKTRLDALDRVAAGGLDSPARAEAERSLRHSRRLSLIGDVGVAMAVAMPFFPDHWCGSDAETCRPTAKKAYYLGTAAALGIGIVGLVKGGRAEKRLEAFDETSRASHQVGVAPLRDGVAASYSVAW